MHRFAASTTAHAAPGDVLACLADPAACASWAPLPFTVERLDGDRFRAGTGARIAGELAGQTIGFGVFVREASECRFALLADGPFSITVTLEFVAAGGPAPDLADPDRRAGASSGGTRATEIRAAVRLGRPQGLKGRALAGAASALLAAGFLDRAIARLARAAERSQLTVVAATRPEARELALAA